MTDGIPGRILSLDKKSFNAYLTRNGAKALTKSPQSNRALGSLQTLQPNKYWHAEVVVPLQYMVQPTITPVKTPINKSGSPVTCTVFSRYIRAVAACIVYHTRRIRTALLLRQQLKHQAHRLLSRSLAPERACMRTQQLSKSNGVRRGCTHQGDTGAAHLQVRQCQCGACMSWTALMWLLSDAERACQAALVFTGVPGVSGSSVMLLGVARHSRCRRTSKRMSSSSRANPSMRICKPCHSQYDLWVQRMTPAHCNSYSYYS
jgi:hypothetical protein